MHGMVPGFWEGVPWPSNCLWVPPVQQDRVHQLPAEPLVLAGLHAACRHRGGWAEIRSVEDNKRVFAALAADAVREGRLRNAAFYYRAAEFLTDPSDPDKESLYASFADAFTRGFADEGIERSLVPYGDGFLPILRLPAVGERRGTVVAHGGFDSFIEEFFCFWRYLADRGYDVVAFEGPGQGAAHRVYGLPTTTTGRSRSGRCSTTSGWTTWRCW